MVAMATKNTAYLTGSKIGICWHMLGIRQGARSLRKAEMLREWKVVGIWLSIHLTVVEVGIAIA